ncbi:hypothetical protein SCULI_v1c03280 [Spiroplasma culicicola AES-1]|uniref:Uncharacterized protein n=2 Tax=Spiroplasma culicicola TaxID=216935 RepID=W6AG32_9MOLU|nr:hypothetical protein SCULI_v1c03280 [Spiroplasma culicicola AES-1]
MRDQEIKKIFFEVIRYQNEIIVSVSKQSSTSQEVKEFVMQSHIDEDIKKYNKGLTNCIKEYKITMNKCEAEIKLATAELRKIIDQQAQIIAEQAKIIEEQAKTIERQAKIIEEQAKTIAQQAKQLEEQAKRISKLERILKLNNINVDDYD